MSGPVLSFRENHSAERLLCALQELWRAPDLQSIARIAARAARELTGADGASFVLRDGELCHYVQEDAISSLWQGRRFPMSSCLSGWVMQHRSPAVVDDIALDPRIPSEVYRPTFVRSMAMVPVHARAPLGAIGCYWGSARVATAHEVALLQALADGTAVAMENIVLRECVEKAQARMSELDAATRDLAERCGALADSQRQNDALNELLAHDLRSPAAGILLTARVRLRDQDLPERERRRWSRVLCSAELIQRTAMNLLDTSSRRLGTLVPRLEEIDLTALLEEVAEILEPFAASRGQRIELRPGAPRSCRLRADGGLLRRVLQNLVDNALRHGPALGAVYVEARRLDAPWVEVVVRDEGPGIPVHLRDHIFDRYARLDGQDAGLSSVGRGLGLTFCKLAVEAHGGRIEVRDNEGGGSCFCVLLPA
ncbi:ATP-binding protein [Sorangium cellulosum]|uniref:sensor histidine kinase n=1 Tax=Sorangium cellulosum TaxID=56 RepID=UPI0013314E1B|nr:ATP-binding protein [Sorangium cellulosum]